MFSPSNTRWCTILTTEVLLQNSVCTWLNDFFPSYTLITSSLSLQSSTSFPSSGDWLKGERHHRAWRPWCTWLKGYPFFSVEVRITWTQGEIDDQASGIWTYVISSVGLLCTDLGSPYGLGHKKDQCREYLLAWFFIVGLYTVVWTLLMMPCEWTDFIKDSILMIV